MRKHLLASAAFAASALIGTAAFAADPIMPAPAPAPAPVAPAPVFFDWSGFYVGLHAGYNWERKRVNYPGYAAWVDDVETDAGFFDVFVISDPVHARLEADGFHGGLQGGFNWQAGAWVLGVEGDFSWTGADGSTTAPAAFAWGAWDDMDDANDDFDNFVADGADGFPVTVSQKVKWFGTARARIGYAFDNVLLYGTGGFAWKRSELTFAGTVPAQAGAWGPVAFASTTSNTHTGWTLGGGVEVAVTENVSLKGEYLYMDFGSETYNMVVPIADDVISVPTRVRLHEHAFRIGLNWRFATGGMGAY